MRRAHLAIVVVALVIGTLGACTADGAVRGPAATVTPPPATPPPAAAPLSPPEPTPSSPAAPDPASTVPAVRPGPAAAERAATKATAARFVEAVGTWSGGAPRDPADHLRRAGVPPTLAGEARLLLDASATDARASVVRVQMTGLTATTAAVSVLVRQELTRDGRTAPREIGLDVRLERPPGGAWAVTDRVVPARPGMPPPRPVGPLAAQVLADPRIELAAPARDDVASGRIGDPILAALREVSRTHTLTVNLFATAHPRTVFPSPRLSNQAVGRGADVVAVDGRPVESLDPATLIAVMTAAGRAGATEVGGPQRPPGVGFFTDPVHQDHVHVGITPGKPRAGSAPAPPGRVTGPMG